MKVSVGLGGFPLKIFECKPFICQQTSARFLLLKNLLLQQHTSIKILKDFLKDAWFGQIFTVIETR